MPQLNPEPDEAANDERKIFNDEFEGEDEERWHDSELSELKGGLVDADDVNPGRQAYDNKVSSHRNGDSTRRNKESLDRDAQNDMVPSLSNCPYNPQQDISPLVTGLGHRLFPNVVLPASSQVPYSHYMPYMNPLLYGASSPTDIDGKQVTPRGSHPDIPPMYPLPGQLGQIPNPLARWSPSSLYPLCTASAMTGMLPYPYPFHNFSSAPGMSSVSPFPLVSPNARANGMHPSMLPHAGLQMPGGMMNGHGKTIPEKKNLGPDQMSKRRENKSEKAMRPYVKKPLNAFMIYMKEQRAEVVAECTLKESAAINQILGRKWHSLNKEQQQKYYEMARKERQRHMQQFPGWSARDNYGKRKKRKKEKSQDCTAQNPKKCRAVFGLEQQQLWCAPCRRKKKCVRYQHDGEDSDEDSDASVGAFQEASENFPHNSMSQSNSFDSTETSMMTQSTTSGISVNKLNQSLLASASERLSPGQPVVNDPVKQESSPHSFGPNTRPQNQAKGTTSSHSQQSANDLCRVNNNTIGNNAKRPRDPENKNQVSNGKSRSVIDNSHHFQQPQSNCTSARSKPEADLRSRRASSGHSESSIQPGQNMFNSSMLSPNMGLSSAHGNSPFFPHLFFSAAAASLPTSPLGGIMGFPGFKGLGSSIGMGLNGGGSSGAPGTHPGSSASRHTSSALEGKS